MPFFNGWPWVNFQEHNLDWIIKQVNSIKEGLPDLIREYAAHALITHTYDSATRTVSLSWEVN